MHYMVILKSYGPITYMSKWDSNPCDMHVRRPFKYKKTVLHKYKKNKMFKICTEIELCQNWL